MKHTIVPSLRAGESGWEGGSLDWRQASEARRIAFERDVAIERAADMRRIERRTRLQLLIGLPLVAAATAAVTHLIAR